MKKSQDQNSSKNPRNETEGMLNFSKEMLSALGTALIFIIYVIQAFTIPTGSMEKSLLVGDFLLGIKFVYGAPVLPNTSSLPFLNKLPIPDTYWKFPGLTSPKRGDVIIFKYPGFDKKDYIKRCVAVAGDTLEVIETDLYINGIKQVLPPKGQFVEDSLAIKKSGSPIPLGKRPHFEPLYIPKKGDTLTLSNLPTREFHFYKNLIRQEHPYKEVQEHFSFFLEGKEVTHDPLPLFYDQRQAQWQTLAFDQFQFGRMDTINYWTQYDYILDIVFKAPHFADQNPEITRVLTLDGDTLTSYVVQQDNYFMMGDNRDNSADSRYWGFLNRNYIKAQALIIYFSFENKDKKFHLLNPFTWWRILGKIRFNRMGKLIRNWDGMPEDIEANRKPVMTPDPMDNLIDSMMTADSLSITNDSADFVVE